MGSDAHSPALILASSSVYRRSLLARLGVPFRAVAHRVDEEEMQAGSPRALAEALAIAKAQSVATPGHHVLGGDQIVCFDGEILGKPGSIARAEAQLARLQGKTHQLITATALMCPDGRLISDVHEHMMTLRPLSPDAIRAYVATDRPVDCCGAYKIEKLGIALFAHIEGVDHTAITGMPLMAVSRMLRDEGFAIP